MVNIKEDFEGDKNFDGFERWTPSACNGVNLLQVAVHQPGHALGLGHSDVAAAVMAPFYVGFDRKFEFHISKPSKSIFRNHQNSYHPQSLP